MINSNPFFVEKKMEKSACWSKHSICIDLGSIYPFVFHRQGNIVEEDFC